VNRASTIYMERRNFTFVPKLRGNLKEIILCDNLIYMLCQLELLVRQVEIEIG